MEEKTVSVAHIQCQVLMDLLEESKEFTDKDLKETIDDSIRIVKEELAREQNKIVNLIHEDYLELVTSAKEILDELADRDGKVIRICSLVPPPGTGIYLQEQTKRLAKILSKLNEI